MKKFLLSMALVLCTAGAMAQTTIDLTFNRNNSAAGTDATVTVGNTGDIDITGIASTVACNYNWKAFSATSETFPNSNILCPDKNTKDMTGNAAGVITFTLAGVPDNYEFTAITLKSVALNGSGEFQGDNANAQHIDFILKQDDTTIAEHNDVAIKVNSNGGESVTVNLVPEAAIRAENGTVTFKLKLVNNYTANGCFYGLFKVTIDTEVEETVEPEPEPSPELGIFHPSGTSITAAELMEVTEPKYIAIKGLANKNYEYWNYVSGEANTSTEYFKQNAIFVWEPVADGVAGSYYLRKIGNGYMQSSNPGTYAETTEGAAVFTAVKPVEVASGANGELQFNRDANSTTLIENAGGADNIVRFVTGGKWLNIGDRSTSAQAPAFNNGYGTFTIYQICVLEEFEETLNITIKNSGNEDFATFYSNAPTQMPEGVTAYTITEAGIANGYISLNEIENGATIPANTGVILKTAVEADEEIAITVAGDDVAPLTTNLLSGSVDNKNITEEAYVLGIVDGVVGLYKAKMTDGVWLNNAGKAYLPASAVPAAAQASNGFRFGEGTTGVDEITENRVQSTVIYDLTGRRVEAITAPGIYIVGGKKVLVK